MNRRTFLVAMTGCTGVAIGGRLPVGMAAPPTAKASPPPRAPLSERFSYEGFRAYIGETFYVYGGQGLRNVVNLQLVAVDGQRQGKETEQFVARFRGPGDDPLAAGVYQFQHPTAGEFRLLIAPAVSDSKGHYYRADFNLLR